MLTMKNSGNPSVPVPESADRHPIPAGTGELVAVVHVVQQCVIVLGRSGVCSLDTLAIDTSGRTGKSLLRRADVALIAAGWERLGPWRPAPPPTPMTRRLGIAEHARAAPVQRTPQARAATEVGNGQLRRDRSSSSHAAPPSKR
ncbi:hypothetical protein [Nocardia sp. NPDC052566]|uniref:hypothetical protein n=1 Tax=Nocardia sp. NPDC052566 TaxID=3364330 RepID=UPI0037CA80F0